MISHRLAPLLRYGVPALLVVALVQATDLRAQRAVEPAGPSVIYWPGMKPGLGRTPTEVGLLYTPERLGVLALHAPHAVTVRIKDAIHQDTPIVVLWTIPPMSGTPVERPFSAVIVEAGGSYNSVPRVEPLWIDQHAEDLRLLDSRTPFPEVGVMAAFPRSAFAAGRLVIIYRHLGQTETGSHRGVQRFGLIEWNGTATP